MVSTVTFLFLAPITCVNSNTDFRTIPLTVKNRARKTPRPIYASGCWHP